MSSLHGAVPGVESPIDGRELSEGVDYALGRVEARAEAPRKGLLCADGVPSSSIGISVGKADKDKELGLDVEEEPCDEESLLRFNGSSSAKRSRLPCSEGEDDEEAGEPLSLPPRSRRPPRRSPSASLPPSLFGSDSDESDESGEKISGDSSGSERRGQSQRRRSRQRRRKVFSLSTKRRSASRWRLLCSPWLRPREAAAVEVVRRPRSENGNSLRRPISQPSRWCEALLKRLKEEEEIEEMEMEEKVEEEVKTAAAAEAARFPPLPPPPPPPRSLPPPLTPATGALVPLAPRPPPAAKYKQQQQQLKERSATKQQPAITTTTTTTATPPPLEQQQQQQQKTKKRKARILRDGALTLSLYGPSEAFMWQTRVHHFTSTMRSLLGDRRPVREAWRGSVLDSVVGVFLTQNVSDFLSSKAYMNLASRWPGGARGKGKVRAEWKTPSSAELRRRAARGEGNRGSSHPASSFSSSPSPSPSSSPLPLLSLAAPSAPPEALHACRCTDSDFDGSETDTDEEMEEEEEEKEKEKPSPAAAAAAPLPLPLPPPRHLSSRRRLVLAPALPVEGSSLFNRVPRLPVACEWTREDAEAAERARAESLAAAAAASAAAASSLLPPPHPPPSLALALAPFAPPSVPARRRRRRAVPWPSSDPKVLPHPWLPNSWSCANCRGRAQRPRCLSSFNSDASDAEREEELELRRWRDRPLPAWNPLGRRRDARRRATARPVSFSASLALLGDGVEEGGSSESEDEGPDSLSGDDDSDEGNEGKDEWNEADKGDEKPRRRRKNFTTADATATASEEALDHVDWLSLSLAPLASVSDAIRCRGLNNLIAGRIQALLTWVGQVGPGTGAAAAWVRAQQEGAARSAAAEAARSAAARSAALGARAAAEERIARARERIMFPAPPSSSSPSPMLLLAPETPRCCGGGGSGSCFAAVAAAAAGEEEEEEEKEGRAAAAAAAAAPSPSPPVLPQGGLLLRSPLSSELCCAPATPMLVDEGSNKPLSEEQEERKEEEEKEHEEEKQQPQPQPQLQPQPPPPSQPPLPPHHPHRHPLSLEWLRDEPPDAARAYLMSLEGLGRKSAACVSLLSLRVRDFPVDTNVGRVCARLGWLPLESEHALEQLDEYAPEPEVHRFLHSRLAARFEVEELHELHYQMITLGKVLCSKRAPNCCACPLRPRCEYARADGARLKREAGDAARAVAVAAAEAEAEAEAGPEAGAEAEAGRSARLAVVAVASVAEIGGGARRVACRAPALPTSAGPVLPVPIEAAVVHVPVSSCSPAFGQGGKEEEEGEASPPPAVALAPPPPPAAAPPPPPAAAPPHHHHHISLAGPSLLALERARTTAALLNDPTAADAVENAENEGETATAGDKTTSPPSALAAEVARLIAAGDRLQETADGACGEGVWASTAGPLELAARLADRAAAVLGFGEALAAFRSGGSGVLGSDSERASLRRRSEAATALRRRYLALSSSIHPDKCPLPGADRAFAALQEAHGILAECFCSSTSSPSSTGRERKRGEGGEDDDDDENDDDGENGDDEEEEGDAAIPYPTGRSCALRTAFVVPDDLTRRLLSPALVKQHAALKDEPFLLLEMPEAARRSGGGGGGGSGSVGGGSGERVDVDGSLPSSSFPSPPPPPRSWRHNRLAPYFERLLEYRGEGTLSLPPPTTTTTPEVSAAPPPLSPPPLSPPPPAAVPSRCYALLVPVRTAMAGRFPLHGTYFQINECFLDRSTLRAPLRVRRRGGRRSFFLLFSREGSARERALEEKKLKTQTKKHSPGPGHRPRQAPDHRGPLWPLRHRRLPRHAPPPDRQAVLELLPLRPQLRAFERLSLFAASLDPA